MGDERNVSVELVRDTFRWQYYSLNAQIETISPTLSSRSIDRDVISTEKVPPRLDYRSQLPPIRDQGVAGSCIPHASVVPIEWHARSIRLQASPQFVYDLRMGGGSGMTFTDAFRILQRFGVPRERVYPTVDTERTRPQKTTEIDPTIPENVYHEALHFRLSSYYAITTPEELRAALVKHGPCLVLTAVYSQRRFDMWNSYPGDIIQGFHGMAIVGYDEGGFWIRNSWGEDWGEDGYVYFPLTDWGKLRNIWGVTHLDIPIPRLDPLPAKAKTSCKCQLV